MSSREGHFIPTPSNLIAAGSWSSDLDFSEAPPFSKQSSLHAAGWLSPSGLAGKENEDKTRRAPRVIEALWEDPKKILTSRFLRVTCGRGNFYSIVVV